MLHARCTSYSAKTHAFNSNIHYSLIRLRQSEERHETNVAEIICFNSKVLKVFRVQRRMQRKSAFEVGSQLSSMMQKAISAMTSLPSMQHECFPYYIPIDSLFYSETRDWRFKYGRAMQVNELYQTIARLVVHFYCFNCIHIHWNIHHYIMTANFQLNRPNTERSENWILDSRV